MADELFGDDCEGSGEASEQRELANSEPRLSFIFANDPSIVVKRTEWLEPDRIPFGVLTLFQGDGGVGKTTTIACAIAAWSRGAGFFTPRSFDPITTMIVAEEDGLGHHKARLRELGADLARVAFVKGAEFSGSSESFAIPDHVGILEAAIVETGARAVYIDALHSHLVIDGDGKMPQKVRAAIRPLIETMDRRACALMATRHYGKMRGGAKDRGLGSAELANVARSVLDFGMHPNIEGQFALAPSKANRSKFAPALAYRIEEIQATDDIGDSMIITKAVIEGIADDVTADDLAMQQPAEPEARTAAQDWLQDYLADGEWHPSSLVLADAKKAGIAQATLYRARKALGVEALQQGFPAKGHWRLSSALSPEGLDSHASLSRAGDKPALQVINQIPTLSTGSRLCRSCKTLTLGYDQGDGTYLCGNCATALSRSADNDGR